MSITLLLEMAADGYGDRAAVGPRDARRSYLDLARSARRGAALLRERGAPALAFVGVNGPALATLVFAAAAAGVPFSPLNYRLADDRLVALIARLDEPTVVADAGIAVRLTQLGVPGVLTTDEWLAGVGPDGPAPEAEPAVVEDDDVAIVLFTSGTTGEPKAVQLRHGNLVSYILGTVEFAAAAPMDAVLVSVPPYHVAGIASTLSNIYAGRRMVHLPNFDAAGWAGTVAAEGITAAMVVPTMLARIVDVLVPDDPRLAGLRSLAYGGAAVPEPVLVRALELLPWVEFTNAYGLTETSSTITLLTPDDHRAALADPAQRRRLRSAGRAVPGIELQVRDDGGRVCGAGELGELWVRGAQVSGRYAGQGSVLDTQGWFPTRDRAELDADGFVFLHGRSDDTIIRGGENIAPMEIEAVLRELPGVLDVCVVGVPDDEWGQRTVAVVQADPAAGLDREAVRSFARGRLRGSLTPDDVLVSAGGLPYSPLGKLLRPEVAETATAALVQRRG